MLGFDNHCRQELHELTLAYLILYSGHNVPLSIHFPFLVSVHMYDRNQTKLGVQSGIVGIKTQNSWVVGNGGKNSTITRYLVSIIV